MTAFVKEKFQWDGSYLMYNGNHDLARNMEEVHPDCHPSWIGKPKPTFVARFKYGPYKPWKAWVNFLVKNVWVEQYVLAERELHPVGAMQQFGYKGKV